MSMVTSAPQSPILGGTSHVSTSNPNNVFESKWYENLSFEECAKELKKRVRARFAEELIKLPSGLYNRIKTWCVLSGSSISSIFHSEAVKDFDLWSTNDAMITVIENDLLTKYQDCIMKYGDTEGYSDLGLGQQAHKKVVTDNAIMLKGRIQFITLGMYEDQRELFDLVHCKPYYHLDTDTFYISPQQMDCIRNKKLLKNPEGRHPTAWRISKFEKRGWTF